MKRYIEADALITELKDRWNKCDLGEFAENVWSVIDDAPSIDIVRCGECKHRHRTERGIIYCDRITYGFGHTDDDFCSYGEREGE